MVITFLKFEDVTKALTLVQMVFDGLIFFSLTPQALTMFYNFCLTKQMTSEILVSLPSNFYMMQPNVYFENFPNNNFQGCLKHGKSTNHPNIQEMAANALPLLSSLSDADLNWISDLANKKNLDQSPGEDKPEKSDV